LAFRCTCLTDAMFTNTVRTAMKTASLFVAAFLGIFAACASGQVIVMKGTARFQKGNNVSVSTSPYKVSIVFDVSNPAQLVGNLILANTKKKTVTQDGYRTYGVSVVSTRPKETFFITAAGSNFTNSSNFNNGYVLFKGLKKTLQLANDKALPFTFASPISGIVSDTGASNGSGASFLGSMLLTFDAAKTQTFNAGNGTATQAAVDNVMAGFLGKGFTAVSPSER